MGRELQSQGNVCGHLPGVDRNHEMKRASLVSGSPGFVDQSETIQDNAATSKLLGKHSINIILFSQLRHPEQPIVMCEPSETTENDTLRPFDIHNVNICWVVRRLTIAEPRVNPPTAPSPSPEVSLSTPATRI